MTVLTDSNELRDVECAMIDVFFERAADSAPVMSLLMMIIL